VNGDEDSEVSEDSDDTTDEGSYRPHFSSKANRTLGKFKAYQTPPGVSSLHLKYPEHLWESHEDTKELLDFFCDFWSTRLEYLEVNNYVDELLELFKTAPVRVLNIGTMESWPDTDSQFYHIEEISMRRGFASGHVGPIENITNLKQFYIAYGDDDPDDDVKMHESDSDDELNEAEHQDCGNEAFRSFNFFKKQHFLLQMYC